VTRFEAPRGTHDILPADWPAWRRVIETMEELCGLYGYRRIQTPAFEDTEVFLRTSGQGSDVVQKEMYTFTDRGGRSLTLRPEGTAPICRAYLQHGLERRGLPQKLYTIATMYRYSAPQRGRYREHWQLSVEAIGSDDPAVDAELIQLYDELLGRLGVSRYRLLLNSIGDRECRPAYLERLNDWLDGHAGVLDGEAREKRATSPLRVFDVKNEAVQRALQDAPKIGDALCEACREHFASVRAYLDAYGVEYEIVPALVRGLDYYSRTTFEFVDEAIGAQSSIVGGGRYDYLIEELGGPPTPAIGFGAGIERLLLSLGDDSSPRAGRIDVFLAAEPDVPRERVLGTLLELRRLGLPAETDYAGRSLRGQLTHARRLGADVVVIARVEGAVVRRTGETDVEVPYDDLVSTLSG
jgi:histidyl-tRNA synthetase